MRLIDADNLVEPDEEYGILCLGRRNGKQLRFYEELFKKRVHRAPTVPAIPMERIKQLRTEIRQLQLLGYATVDGKRQIASRAVLELIDNIIKEYEG